MIIDATYSDERVSGTAPIKITRSGGRRQHHRRGVLTLALIASIGLSLSIGRENEGRGAPPVVGDRLPPPQQVEAIPLARSAGPAARMAPKAESLPAHLWTLPIPEIVRTPVKTSVESNRTGWLHPARDVPALASDERPSVPQIPRLGEVPRSFVASRNPHAGPPLSAFPRDIDKAPSVNANPADSPGFQFLVRAVPAPAAKPAPPLNVSIPDPDAALRAMQLPPVVPPGAPLIGGEPAVSRESPPRPMLPISPG